MKERWYYVWESLMLYIGIYQNRFMWINIAYENQCYLCKFIWLHFVESLLIMGIIVGIFEKRHCFL